jgi:hypothetical protein
MVKKTRMSAYRHGNGNPIEMDPASPSNEKSGLISKAVGSERRKTERFPIELPAELCILDMRIPGTTVNISSGGLLVKCSQDSVKVGARVQVRVTNWPNASRSNSVVVLVIEGAVVRDSPEYLAVRRIRYAFVED